MSADTVEVTVDLLGKPYKIACQPGEEDVLKKAASHVNGKIREINASGQVAGMDKVAVFAALNIANELIRCGHEKEAFAAKLSDEIGALREKIDTILPSSGQA